MHLDNLLVFPSISSSTTATPSRGSHHHQQHHQMQQHQQPHHHLIADVSGNVRPVQASPAHHDSLPRPAPATGGQRTILVQPRGHCNGGGGGGGTTETRGILRPVSCTPPMNQASMRSATIAKRSSATMSRRSGGGGGGQQHQQQRSSLAVDPEFELPAPPEGFDGSAAAAAGAETICLLPQSTAGPGYVPAEDQ